MDSTGLSGGVLETDYEVISGLLGNKKEEFTKYFELLYYEIREAKEGEHKIIVIKTNRVGALDNIGKNNIYTK